MKFDCYPKYLHQVYPVLSEHFSDFEIVLVNNLPGKQLDEAMSGIDAKIKQQVYVLNLSSKTNKNHAFVAG